MSTTPPTPKNTETAAMRKAANRRIALFVGFFALLLAGALGLIMREENRRGTLLIQPELPTTPAVEQPARPRVPATTDPSATRQPRGTILEQSAQMEEALAAYREAGDFLKAQRFDQAEERALAALKIFPKMPEAQRILGLIYLQQGNIPRAIATLEASLRNEPFNPEALTNLSFAYYQAQNIEMAMELIETCRRLHPDYKPALLQEGVMRIGQADGGEEAVVVLREAIAAFPNLPGPRNNLAVALARTGDLDAARAEFAKLLELDPNNFSALYNVGALYAKETNAPVAVSWLRRAVAHIPPRQFRPILNDPDLEPIRETPEFIEFLKELDPVFPGPRPRP